MIVRNCIVKVSSISFCLLLIPRYFCPGYNNIPVTAECRVTTDIATKHGLQVRVLQQFVKFVTPALFSKSLVSKNHTGLFDEF